MILTYMRNKSGSGLTSRSDTESVQKEPWSHDTEDEMWTGGLQKLTYRSQLLGASVMTFKKKMKMQVRILIALTVQWNLG